MNPSAPKGYYPIIVDMQLLNCLVIGGGEIAARKVRKLLNAGANRLTVVSPELCEELKDMHQMGQFHYLESEYNSHLLQDAHIVFAATNLVPLNLEITRDAKLYGKLVCNVSEGEQGNFITPAFFQRGDLTVALSTGGKNPAFNKYLKHQLEVMVDEQYAQALDVLAKVRLDLKRDIESADLRQNIMRYAVEQILKGPISNYDAWYTSLIKKFSD